MVRRWRSWFLEGRQNLHDDERSGSPVTATDNAAVAAVRNVVEADRRVTIDEIMIRMPPGIEIRRSSIGTIMSDVLNFRKVWARWVPRLLLENHKQQRMVAARAFLEMHQRDGDQLFSRMVTGDESWVHLSTPETKRQSMVWKKPEESAPKRAKVTISAGKVMAMENFKWEIFTHPPYSQDLAPSDFHRLPSDFQHSSGTLEASTLRMMTKCRRRRTTGYEDRTRLGTTVVSKNCYNESATGALRAFRTFKGIRSDLRTHLNPYPEINIAREIARSRTQNKHNKDKETFDKQHRTPHFEVNDLVLVKNYRHPDTDEFFKTKLSEISIQVEWRQNFDELDSKARGGNLDDRVINQILTEMDGMIS
ncbi:hypothetical protein LAZ67_2004680 [Cordylochernes scorpioides]|uniref:Transposase n=1 Tax=Cordylochernes scorpioides TaxID=51811 RepID=A0ABY6K4X5_9ARAC|nr:hypothetical protein LAZ67_2004680 [Cordylochernes scorpioides]